MSGLRLNHLCYCNVFLSVHCNLVVICWESAGLLALLYVMFYYVFVTFPCGVLGQVCCLIVSIPNLCLLSNFKDVSIDERARVWCCVCGQAHLGLIVGFLLLRYSFVYTVEPLSFFISFLYLDLYLLGDDTLISLVSSCEPNIYLS